MTDTLATLPPPAIALLALAVVAFALALIMGAER